MSTIPALGARSLPASTHAANPYGDSKSSATSAGKLAKSTDSAPTSLSSDGLDLQKHVASVGNATVDFAQNFLSSFTNSLFGDAAKGAVIDFDSASLDTSSTFGVAVQHSSGPNGSSDAAAFQLSDSSHFIGKGTITTADGRKFDFEVEVQYNYDLTAGASQSSGAAQQPDTQAAGNKPVASNSAGSDNLPTVQVPNIDFPGTLADLFKLIGRDLQTALSTGDDKNSQTSNGIDRNTLRNLSLRLLNLVDSKDTNTYSAPSSADKAKSAADAYGAQAADPVAAPAASDATPDAKAATA
ncbi:hypothetical protein [Duganella hordei]|uniref:hypothetical protein n=1 Tax=Duganella hordei TaxID=2865934 RepID=UPI0030E77BCD